jgi:hypothetical protein
MTAIIAILLFLILLCLLPRAVYSTVGYFILLVLGLWFLQEHPGAVKPIVVVGGGLMVFGLYVMVAAKLKGITPEELGRRAVERWLKDHGMM